jgi:hypothetical protein
LLWAITNSYLAHRQKKLPVKTGRPPVNRSGA